MTTITPENRAVEAAERMIRAHIRHPQCRRQELELAAWILGADGIGLPQFPDAGDQLHARLGYLLGAGKHDAAGAFLDDQLPDAAADKLLMHACVLAGRLMPERLVKIAARHRGRWFDGPFLARCAEPDRLLKLFAGQPLDEHAIATIGEIVIAGRDAGAPVQQAESRWEAIAARTAPPEYSADFRNIHLRLAARESLDEAACLLARYGSVYPRWEIYDGMQAVLGRLAPEDPQRAVNLVAESPEAEDRVDWFGGLSWWFALPRPAEALLADLLAQADAQLNCALAKVLIPSRAPQWLARALAGVDAVDPLQRARDFSPGVKHLQAAGLSEEAEQAREQLYPKLTQVGNGTLGPRELFEVRCAPQLPQMLPWGTGSQLP